MCAIAFFSKYAWVVPLKDKRGITIANAFQEILNDCKRKPNKIWVDQGCQFCNNPFKKWLEDNDIKRYSTNTEGKSAVAEIFIRTLENKIYMHMKSVSKKCLF